MLLTGKKPDGSPLTLRLKTLAITKAITIGRGTEADVTIDDPQCSRVHSAIRYWDDIFVVRDMNSRNGTFVNGQKIEVAKLGPGDVLKIGNTELRAIAEGTSGDVTMVSRSTAPGT
jgi:pSer/pThr/pTyr-binding forkhead associated (FHA) protein